MNNLPCIDCITLPVCRAQVFKETEDTMEPGVPLGIYKLFDKCSLLEYYVYRGANYLSEDSDKNIKRAAQYLLYRNEL
jgi:hypothetical protein